MIARESECLIVYFSQSLLLDLQLALSAHQRKRRRRPSSGKREAASVEGERGKEGRKLPFLASGVTTLSDGRLPPLPLFALSRVI